MRHGRNFIVIGVILTAIGLGCDDRRAVTVLETKPAATQPARPTTQELLSGSQQKIALRSIPFTVSVPAQWNIKSQAGVLVLQGMTPSGMVELQIGKHLAPIPEHAELLIAGAKRDAAANPGQYTRAEVRDADHVKVLETRSSGTTVNKPAIDADGAVVAPTSTPMSWKLSAFVQNGHDIDVCELRFIDLTCEQYERDKDLLERVIASFEYDPKAETN